MEKAKREGGGTSAMVPHRRGPPDLEPGEYTDPPDSPDEWRTYADSTTVKSIPSQTAEFFEETHYSHRSVIDEVNYWLFLDGEAGPQPPPGTQPRRPNDFYADAFTYPRPDLKFITPNFFMWPGGFNMLGRVFSTSPPLYLSFPKVDTDAEPPAVVTIWTAVVDTTSLYVSYRESSHSELWSQRLELGATRGPDYTPGHLGVRITCANGPPTIEYLDSYPDGDSPVFEDYLRTELRLATAHFWSHPRLTGSLCAYLAKLTVNKPRYSQINAQAASLGQQLANRYMIQQNLTYFPELNLEQYVSDTDRRLDVLDGFKDQYDRFQDACTAFEMQLDLWGAMLKHARNERASQEERRDDALSRYDSAKQVVKTARAQFEADDGELQATKKAFEDGVQAWRDEQMKKLFVAMFGFILGLVQLCFGDLDGIQAVEGAAASVDGVADQADKMLSGDSLRSLGGCMEALEKIFGRLDELVEAAKKLDFDPDGDMPTTDTISGSALGDVDVDATLTMGEWDKWVLQSDQQLEVAFSNHIIGASEYRLALRKHAVNGRTLAQAQANASRAGQEYVQLQTGLVVVDQDVDNLEELMSQYTEGALEIYEKALVKFYDRQMALRVGILIDLLKADAAHRFYTLSDLRLVYIKPDIDVPDLRELLHDITGDVMAVEESWDKDFQYFEYHSSSEKLPSINHDSLLQGLKDKDTHTAKFTLAPFEKEPNMVSMSLEKSNTQGLPADFHKGFHWRQWGMDPVLRGALPRSDIPNNDMVIVNMWVTTEGVFSDIAEDGSVKYFTGKPQSKLLSYELMKSGEVNITTSTIYEADKHADRTPFTQWVIELERESYEALNLDGLTGLDMHWAGRYMPIKDRRDSAVAV